jgi:acyl carrier protein
MDFVNMISAIEKRLQVTIDLEGLDAQQVTTLRPLCTYIEQVAVVRSTSAHVQ